MQRWARPATPLAGTEGDTPYESDAGHGRHRYQYRWWGVSKLVSGAVLSDISTAVVWINSGFVAVNQVNFFSQSGITSGSTAAKGTLAFNGTAAGLHAHPAPASRISPPCGATDRSRPGRSAGSRTASRGTGQSNATHAAIVAWHGQHAAASSHPDETPMPRGRWKSAPCAEPTRGFRAAARSGPRCRYRAACRETIPSV